MDVSGDRARMNLALREAFLAEKNSKWPRSGAPGCGALRYQLKRSEASPAFELSSFDLARASSAPRETFRRIGLFDFWIWQEFVRMSGLPVNHQSDPFLRGDVDIGQIINR
jgi:hypothetical protein